MALALPSLSSDYILYGLVMLWTSARVNENHQFGHILSLARDSSSWTIFLGKPSHILEPHTGWLALPLPWKMRFGLLLKYYASPCAISSHHHISPEGLSSDASFSSSFFLLVFLKFGLISCGRDCVALSGLCFAYNAIQARERETESVAH